MEKHEGSLTERFKGWFGWTLIGFVADVIGIWGAISATQELGVSSILDQGTSATGETHVFGLITLSDMVVVTLFLTLFVVAALLYHSYQESKTQSRAWPLVAAVFASAFLLWLYLRLWLGSDWWMWVLPCLGVLMLVAMILFFEILCNFTPFAQSSLCEAYRSWARGDLAKMDRKENTRTK